MENSDIKTKEKEEKDDKNKAWREGAIKRRGEYQPQREGQGEKGVKTGPSSTPTRNGRDGGRGERGVSSRRKDYL